MKRKSFLFEVWPRFAYKHARWVLLGTVALVVGFGVLYGVAGGDYSDRFTVPHAEAQELFDLLEQRFPSQAGDSAIVVVKADDGVESEGAKAQLGALIGNLGTLPHVTGVSDPLQNPSDISSNGQIARLTVQYDVRANDLGTGDNTALLDTLDTASAPGFQVEAGGPVIEEFEGEPPGSSEAIGISAAVIILLLAFGSIVAMGLPIMTALLGLTSGFFLVSVGAGFVPLPNFTAQFAAMIGIGVGIDYALLVVNRFREAEAHGRSNQDATLVAAATAGRSVFFAGGTVVIALLGLWASGIESIGWVGTAAALIVLLTVLIAVVVLPAILRYVGPFVDRWRIPILAAPATDLHKGFGYRLSRIVQSQPLLCLVLSLGMLLALTAPVLDLRTGTSDAGNNPTSFTSRRAYDLLSEGFGPGTNGPILVGLIIDNPSAIDKVNALPAELKSLEGVQQVSGVTFNQAQTAAVITVIPTSAPQDQGTVDLINLLRKDLRADFEGSGARPLVGGSTALFIDVGSHVDARLPIFLGAVIALSFVLLMAVFRSILVPLKAALMNLLSIGASFGILVAIFQWGWLGGILGVSREGPVESFLPMMLFSVLFGLSMDYEVFLVSRIREEYVATGDNTESVARGLAATTRVITAAAAIMVCVFAAFGLSNQRVVKEFGIGLASAILLDATVVRLVLVPSLMQLAGDWNWWMPRWLDRILPRLHFDGHALDDPTIPVVAGGSE
ncbi:MAG TPA: MMPL family transporter [Dehalococcoidia bacterium]|nr:MMPL family transporter [Dehalococcoidia bacterium]